MLRVFANPERYAKFERDLLIERTQAGLSRAKCLVEPGANAVEPTGTGPRPFVSGYVGAAERGRYGCIEAGRWASFNERD